MSRASVSGSLAYTEADGVRCSAGIIGGRVSLIGSLSERQITLGVGLHFPGGARHWLTDVASGAVGVFLPGDEHDALYVPGSSYAVVSLDAERLEQVAEAYDIRLAARELGGTGVSANLLPAPRLSRLRSLFERVHAGTAFGPSAERILLGALVEHLGRPPRAFVSAPSAGGNERVVRRARAFIHEHLNRLLSIEVIAAAAATSPRTLHRAFRAVLDETPYSYVLRLRLHRIRHEIISDTERAASLASLANNWEISELGRFSGWYRELFGELPSQTRNRLRPPNSARRH